MITEPEEMEFLDIFGQLDDPRIERKKAAPHVGNPAADLVCGDLWIGKLG